MLVGAREIGLGPQADPEANPLPQRFARKRTLATQLGEELKAVTYNHGLTKKDVSGKIGLSQSQMTFVFRGLQILVPETFGHFLAATHPNTEELERLITPYQALLQGRMVKPEARIVTQEARQRMSEAHKGKTIPNYTRYRMSAGRMGIVSPFKGKTHTEEVRQAISAAHTGKTPSEETRLKMSEARKGKIHSLETRAKMAAALKANPPMKGKHHTEETKRQMSNSHKERNAKLRQVVAL